MLRNNLVPDKIFQDYYDCIIANDGRGLMTLIGEHKRFPDYLYCGTNVIGELARAGEHAALDWLRNSFCDDYQMDLDFSHAAFHYARRGDEERFKPLHELSRDCRGEVVRGLAFGGHHALVDKYVDPTVEYDTRNVLFGYAAADNDVKIRHWLTINNSEKTVYRGHAFAGRYEAVELYLQVEQGNRVGRWWCMHEYARGGWLEAIEMELFLHAGRTSLSNDKFNIASILIRHGYEESAERHKTLHFSENSYVMQYTLAGYLDVTNLRIALGCDLGSVASAFDDSWEVGRVNRLQHLLALISDEQVQGSLIGEHDLVADYPFDQDSLIQIRERQQLMLRYDLSYYHAFTMAADQRQELLKNGESAAVWLLQVQQQLYAMGLPAEMLEHISSYVLGLENRAVNTVHDAVAKKVHRGAHRRVDIKYRDSWHAWLLGKRLRYPTIHKIKTTELQDIGVRNQFNNG